MKISVITPILNSATLIERAIHSVLDQKYDDFEHIIVDGLSDDGTVDILKQHAHLKWISEKDEGQSDAMNKGFSLCTGDVVVYLNADDYFLPGAFKAVIDGFSEGADMVVGAVEVHPPEGEAMIITPQIQLRQMLWHWKEWEHHGENRYRSSFPINPVQYFYRRALQETTPFNASNDLAMDLEFLLATASHYNLVRIDDVLGVFDMHGDSKTVKHMAEHSWKYWSCETFAFIDDYLQLFSKEELIAFKNAQQSGYCAHIHKGIRCSEALMNQLRYLDKLPLKRHPIEKLKGFGRLLKIFREQQV